VQSNTEDKNGILYDALARPDAEHCLEVLVVELRRVKGRDGWYCTGLAGARRCVMKCTGRKQNAVAYPVTEISVVSGREIRGEKIRLMIALDECYEQRPE
jgi:hypothetical protein